MKKYLILLPLIALVLTGFFAFPVYATDMPTPGSDFGPHIAEMTPDHAQDMGAMFGHMISNI